MWTGLNVCTIIRLPPDYDYITEVAPDQPLATRDDIRRLERLIDELHRQQDVHFTRMAQLQADIDMIRGAWSKVKPPPDAEPYSGVERRRASRKNR